MDRLKQLKHFDAIVKRTEALRQLNDSLLQLNDATIKIEDMEGDADYMIRDGLGFNIDEKVSEIELLLKESYSFIAEKQQQLHNQK